MVEDNTCAPSFKPTRKQHWQNYGNQENCKQDFPSLLLNLSVTKTYLNNPQGITEAGGRFFLSDPRIESSFSNPCIILLTSETISTSSLLPKETVRPTTKVGHHPGPKSSSSAILTLTVKYFDAVDQKFNLSVQCGAFSSQRRTSTIILMHKEST